MWARWVWWLLGAASSVVLAGCKNTPTPPEAIAASLGPGWNCLATPSAFDAPGTVFRVTLDGTKFTVANFTPQPRPQPASWVVLTSNPSVSGSDLRKLKRNSGIGNGIAALANLKCRYTASVSGPGPNLGNLSLQYFWNRYPTDFDDENNLSLVVILKAHGLTICFPGDMEVAGWKSLLRNPAFVQAVGEVNVFVASHHGRENGCCEELFSQTNLQPAIVVISDSGIEYATQETVGWYRNRVLGINLNGERRHVLTTRRDGRVLVEATPTATTVSVARVPVG